VELKANFLNTAQEGMLYGEARAVHLGRTTQVWDALVTHGDERRKLALFRCTQLVLYPSRYWLTASRRCTLSLPAQKYKTLTGGDHGRLHIAGERSDAKSVIVAPDTPLLYVLRNDLELNGPKFGCGLAQCGACTVLIDGKSARSCSVTVSAAAKGAITTLEGLGTMEKLHPLQRAFIEEQACQCGYCSNA